VKEQQIHNRDGLNEVLKPIVCPLDSHFDSGKLMLCVDGRMRRCDHVICAWMVDYFENIHLHSMKQPHCAVCKAPKSSFGEGKSKSWQWREYRLSFEKMILVTQGDVSRRDGKQEIMWMIQQLEPQNASSNVKCIFLTVSTILNLLHSVYLGMLRHLMEWVTSFLKQHSRIDKFNQLWAMMPPYPVFTRFNKPFCQVMQWR